MDGDWAPQGAEFWIFAGDGVGDDLSYKVYTIDYGTLVETGSLGANNWYTYAYGSTGAKKWVQVRAVPYQGTVEYFVSTLDVNNELVVTSVPADVTVEVNPSFTSFLTTKGSATTGLSSYESYDVAWTKFAP